MRSCLIATALARRLGLPESEVADTYYTALLMHVGCSALSHETAAAWGNEQRALGAAARTNVADPADIAGTLMPAITEGMSPAERSRVERYAASPQGQEFGRTFDTGSCEVASATARRVGLGAGVERALKEAVEWWNGQGPPDGLQGEEIALPARIARAAADAARFDHLGGTEAVVDALRRRSGGILDPSIVETLTANADELLAETRAGDPRERLLEVEPEPVSEIDAAELSRVAVAFGDLADLKTPWTHGHSDGVAKLAGAAAQSLRLDAQSAVQARAVRPARDLGRIAVSNVIWEKPGPLTAAEWEQARMHSYHSERILATIRGARADGPRRRHASRAAGRVGLLPRLPGPRAPPGRADPGRRGCVSRDDPGATAPAGARDGARPRPSCSARCVPAASTEMRPRPSSRPPARRARGGGTTCGRPASQSARWRSPVWSRRGAPTRRSPSGS